MPRLLVGSTICLLLGLLACGRGGDRWVLLPPNSVEHNLSQCSRPGPSIDGTWSPTEADIDKVERNLDDIARMVPAGAEPIAPHRSYRQYVGVLIHGTRFVYLNAVHSPFTERERFEIASMCDGGSSYWGVLYNPATNQFSDLRRSSGWGS